MRAGKLQKWALLPFLLFLIIGLFVAGTYFFKYPQVVTANGYTIHVQVADSNDERKIGLSNSSYLVVGTGMLFVFDSDEMHGIWMKDMNFPLDIVWLDESKTIVTVNEFISPDTYPTVFQPDAPSRYVLELPAGAADQYGLEIGQQLEF